MAENKTVGAIERSLLWTSGLFDFQPHRPKQYYISEKKYNFLLFSALKECVT